MKKSELKFIIYSFLIWRFGLSVIVFFASKFLPLQGLFLEGGLSGYLSNPNLLSWASFDGTHYLSIARNGYQLAEQAFFPLYPILIKLFGGSAWSGILISNFSFLLALLGIYKLLKIDYSQKIVKTTITLLLLFPASFFFGAIYTESLFLCSVAWSFYFFKKGKFMESSVLGMFASATRVIGIILLPIYLIQIIKNERKLNVKHLWFGIIFLGIGSYMLYLYKVYGDPLMFLHVLPTFGEQRSSIPVFLPQVMYRYLFKILPNLNWGYFIGTFSVVFEFIVGIVFLILSLVSFFKLDISYSLFLIVGYLLPTFSGSFSSLPRYVSILFPAFVIGSLWVSRLPGTFRLFVYAILFIGLCVGLSIFSRGFWFA